jgi:hypothetical protein
MDRFQSATHLLYVAPGDSRAAELLSWLEVSWRMGPTQARDYMLVFNPNLINRIVVWNLTALLAASSSRRDLSSVGVHRAASV